MPLDELVAINDNLAYAIWHIQESEEALLQELHANPVDSALYTTFRHPIKRIEWLAARLAYQRLCQEMDIPYEPIRKGLYDRPYIGDGHMHMSLSHCFPFAGAALSKHTPVGIDIEITSPKLINVQSKYLTPIEIADSNQDLEKLCIYWCAKEAVYKAYTHVHYSSLLFIQIEPFSKALRGSLIGHTPSGHHYLIHYQITARYILAWCKEQRSTD
jgi:4'-phosphopantetheinyl transferase EntD